MSLADFTAAYIAAALWSSNDGSTPEGGEPFDRNYGSEDIAPATLVKMSADCKAFYDAHETDLLYLNLKRDSENVDASAGHDFWLTRNQHGAGFWDGDWEEPSATRLTDAAKAFGEFDLYVGGDGKIHGSPL